MNKLSFYCFNVMKIYDEVVPENILDDTLPSVYGILTAIAVLVVLVVVVVVGGIFIAKAVSKKKHINASKNDINTNT